MKKFITVRIVVIFMALVAHLNTCCQPDTSYKQLYVSPNLSDFSIVEECNPGGGTSCPCSIKDVGIQYDSGYIEVVSNINHVHTWVNAIAYKKYVDSLPDGPLRLSQVKYKYQTKLPVLPHPDTTHHQNPGAVHIMMQMYNGDSTLWQGGKESMEGAFFWSLNPYDINYGKFYMYSTDLKLLETGIILTPDTNWHTFEMEIDFKNYSYLTIKVDSFSVDVSDIPLAFIDRSTWGAENSFGFTVESLAAWPGDSCGYISCWTQQFKNAEVYIKNNIDILDSVATTYYVDATNGNDTCNGTSPATAWKTIDKVNSVVFNPGDSILFKRGEIFRGNIMSVSGSPSGYITYGAYGTGDKPKLFGSHQRNSLPDWTNEGGNIWSNTQYIDIGNIIFNNESFCGIKVWNETDLDSQGKFWYDGNHHLLKIYSVSNPASFYSDIELAVTNYIFNETGKSYIIYENLDLRHGGAHGIAGGYTHHIWIKDVDFSFIGGGNQYDTVRYGNGVEFWNAAHDNIVERCTFNQVYDAAITAQGIDSTGFEVYNIFIRNNIIRNCEYSFEYWELYSNSNAYNIYFENNTCINAGGGWGHSQRPDPNGTHVMLWNNDAQTNDVYVRNNIFYNSADWDIRWSNPADVNEVIFDYNCWYESSGPVARIGETYYDYETQWAEYKTVSGQDTHSIAADPLLESDYSLKDNSPCIDTGATLTTVSDDFKGITRPQGKGYDIGAYEYVLIAKIKNGKNKVNEVRLYPNPVNDKLTVITTPNAKESILAIYTVNGQELLKQQITRAETKIDITNLPRGIYIAKLINDKLVEVRKIIKE